MALEHIVSVFLLGLLNWKVIRNLSFFTSDRSKMWIDIGTVIVVIAGVGMNFIQLFDTNPFLYFPVLLGLELTFFILAWVFGSLDKMFEDMKNPSTIKPLDL